MWTYSKSICWDNTFKTLFFYIDNGANARKILKDWLDQIDALVNILM